MNIYPIEFHIIQLVKPIILVLFRKESKKERARERMSVENTGNPQFNTQPKNNNKITENDVYQNQLIMIVADLSRILMARMYIYDQCAIHLQRCGWIHKQIKSYDETM